MSSTKPVPDTSHYPHSPVAAGHVEPAPRRLRGVLDGEVIFDTLRGLYVWEHPHYPQYYLPLEDVDPAALERLGEAAQVFGADAEERPPGTMRIEWGARGSTSCAPRGGCGSSSTASS